MCVAFFYLHLRFVGCIFNVCLGLKLDVVSAQTLCNGDLVVSLVCGRYPLLLPMLLDVLGSALHLRVTWATLPIGMTGYAMYLSPDHRGCTMMYCLPVVRSMAVSAHWYDWVCCVSLSPDHRGCTMMYCLPVARPMMIPTAGIFSPFL